MNRRLLIKTLGALAATLLLPPLRVARARIQRFVSPSWVTGVQHWEYVAIAEPVDAKDLSPEPAVAHTVCRILQSAKSKTLVTPIDMGILTEKKPLLPWLQKSREAMEQNLDVRRVFERIAYDTKRLRKVEGVGPDD